MTAVDTTSSQPVEPMPDTVDSVLECIARAVDMFELEKAWVEGLRSFPVLAEGDPRAQILAAAGRRLGAFGDIADDALRRNWLRQVVEEVRLRGEAPLGGELSAVAIVEMREALARAGADIADVRASVAAGESLQDYAARAPRAADRVRDLGRIVDRLRGSGLLALGSREDRELATELADALAPRVPLVPSVPESLRVTRDDLRRWASSAGSAEALPRLVRSLIAETEPSAEWIDMPAGTGVASPDADGVVRCAQGNRFVPAGLSFWELSTKQNDSHGKAGRDYDKRVEKTPSAERTDMAYVAVVCAPWTKARDFEQERSSSGDFRQVKALNVDSLEAWLECAPATTVWLREKMGVSRAGVGLLSGWWSKWLESTTRPLDEGLVLAGRDKHAETLRDRCRQGRGVVTIGGHVHYDEIVAFVAAALVASRWFGKAVRGCCCMWMAMRRPSACFAVETLSGSSRRNPECARHDGGRAVGGLFAEHLPAGSRHRMIVPVPGSTQAEIVLDAVDGGVVAERLRAVGVDFGVAEEHGILARMSLPALRRCLAVRPELHRPAWAAGPIAQTLRRSVLLNIWNQSRDGDRQIVERFMGCSHEAVSEALHELGGGDAPMILTDEIWHVASPADTWMLLDGQLTRADIEAFGEIAHEVLTDLDPLADLTGDERIRAQFEGVRARYSSQIKRGIATTLALLGSRPPMLQGTAVPVSSAAATAIRRILRSANSDSTPRTWIVVSEVLPLLAEAAPDAILDSLRTCRSDSHSFARAMFTDGRSDDFGFPPSSAHLRILEALELLAWSPDYLLATVDLLAGLAAVDPGGVWSNRPATSLSSIMCPWKPNTSASAEERLNAIGMLRRSHGGVAWDLVLSMLPYKNDLQLDSRGPLFRDWKGAGPRATQGEYSRVVSSVAEMLTEDVGHDADRWAELVSNVTSLPENARNKVSAALDRVADAGPSEAFKSAVWPKLSSMVTRHRQHCNAKWAFAETEVEVFDALAERLCPAAPSIVYGRLFSSGLTFVNGVRATDGWEAFHAASAAMQAEAVAAILDAGGIAAVLDFASEVEQPVRVGTALGRVATDADVEMLAAMHDAADAVTQCALGYFGHRFDELGWHGIHRLRECNARTPQAAADLLRAIAPIHQPWTQVAALGGSVAAAYWERASYYDIGVPQDLDQLLEVSRRLREAGRCDFAAMLLSFGADAHESEPEYLEEVADCLEQRIGQAPPDGRERTPMGDYHLATLIKTLDRHRDHLGSGRVARFEWLYYPALRDDPDFQAPNIYRGMSQDPDLFAQMVELAFKPANAAGEDRAEPNESRQRLALNAFDVLRSWPEAHFVPDLDERGGVNNERLNSLGPRLPHTPSRDRPGRHRRRNDWHGAGRVAQRPRRDMARSRRARLDRAARQRQHRHGHLRGDPQPARRNVPLTDRWRRPGTCAGSALR